MNDLRNGFDEKKNKIASSNSSFNPDKLISEEEQVKILFLADAFFSTDQRTYIKRKISIKFFIFHAILCVCLQCLQLFR